jgi:hypothetical protein
MLKLEISKEDLSRPEVYSQLIQLLECLNGSTTPVAVKTPVKKGPSRRLSELVGEPDIDVEVQEAFGDTIKKAKSLYFMSIIKRLGEANSDEVERQMKMHYPNFTRKSIGGITGAIRRWLTKARIELPYASRADQTRSGVHIFTWVRTEGAGLSASERGRLLDTVSTPYRKHLEHLLSQGSIGKDTVKRKWAAFSKEISDLGTSYFENHGDRIIFRA